MDCDNLTRDLINEGFICYAKGRMSLNGRQWLVVTWRGENGLCLGSIQVTAIAFAHMAFVCTLELSFPTALHFCQHDMRTGETVDACLVGNWPCPTRQECDCVCWSCDLVMPACLPTQRQSHTWVPLGPLQ